jgi:cell division protease FtsH
MVSIYGLNDRIGNISFYDSSGQQEYTFGKPYSEQTAQIIDQEVKKLIDESYVRTTALLSKHKEQLTGLAERLLEKEVIFKEDLEQIFGKRPWADRDVPALSSNGNGSPEKQLPEATSTPS